MSKHKFTLIEMLVVITIIAILASLIASSVMNSIRTGRIVACGSNLKNQGVAIEMYRNANNQFFPPWLSCSGIEQPEILICPLDEEKGREGCRPDWIEDGYQLIELNDMEYSPSKWSSNDYSTVSKPSLCSWSGLTFSDATRNYSTYNEIRSIEPDGCSYLYEFSQAPCSWEGSNMDRISCYQYKMKNEMPYAEKRSVIPITRCYYHIDQNTLGGGGKGILTNADKDDPSRYNADDGQGPQFTLNYCISGDVSKSLPHPWWLNK